MKIIGVSDVSIGYGSPQIIRLMQSLGQHYGTSDVLLFEPDNAKIEPARQIGKYPVLRMDTMYDPYSEPGRIEYCIRVAKEINKRKPDVLVLFCTFTLPVLFKLKFRPRKVIYYHIEYAPFYGDFDIEMNLNIGGKVDLLLYPEENRARLDIEKCGYKDIPIEIIYNSSQSVDELDLSRSRNRENKILYQGLISRDLTFADYYLEPRLQRFPIDLYGTFSTKDSHYLESRFVELTGNIRYLGYLKNSELSRVRKKYSYSIVMWNPISENYYYACPNKFFESIFDAVPPIAAPHPQCKLIIKQYNCGIVMNDWSFNAFEEALKKAMNLLGTHTYDQMVENCLYAAQQELNWEKQFMKVAAHL